MSEYSLNSVVYHYDNGARIQDYVVSYLNDDLSGGWRVIKDLFLKHEVYRSTGYATKDLQARAKFYADQTQLDENRTEGELKWLNEELNIDGKLPSVKVVLKYFVNKGILQLEDVVEVAKDKAKMRSYLLPEIVALNDSGFEGPNVVNHDYILERLNKTMSGSKSEGKPRGVEGSKNNKKGGLGSGEQQSAPGKNEILERMKRMVGRNKNKEVEKIGEIEREIDYKEMCKDLRVKLEKEQEKSIESEEDRMKMKTELEESQKLCQES